MEKNIECKPDFGDMDLNQYYTKKQVCEMLKIKSGTFYRQYYQLLISDNKTLARAGHQLYFKESVLRFVCQVSLEDCERLSKRLSEINPYVQRKKKGKYSQNNLFGTGSDDVQ